MGLISTFKENHREAGNHRPQAGRWNVVVRAGQPCLYLQVYRSGDDECEQDPPQQMVFEPRHIAEFRKMLSEWEGVQNANQN